MQTPYATEHSQEHQASSDAGQIWCLSVGIIFIFFLTFVFIMKAAAKVQFAQYDFFRY